MRGAQETRSVTAASAPSAPSAATIAAIATSSAASFIAVVASSAAIAGRRIPTAVGACGHGRPAPSLAASPSRALLRLATEESSKQVHLRDLEASCVSSPAGSLGCALPWGG